MGSCRFRKWWVLRAAAVAVTVGGFGAPARACVEAVSLTPNGGVGQSEVFTAVYRHCQGAAVFRIAQFWVGPEVTPQAPRVNGSFTAGVFSWEGAGDTCLALEDKRLVGPNGTLDCSRSDVSAQGNDLTVTYAVEFDPVAFAGSHQIFFDAKGGVGDPEPRLGWTLMGNYKVEAGVEPPGGDGSTGGDGGDSDGGATGGVMFDEGDSGDSGEGDDGGIPAGTGFSSGDGSTGCACRSQREAPTWFALLWLGLVALRRRARPQIHC